MYQSSSAQSNVLTHSFWSSCMDRRKNGLFGGLKVTPWLFGFPPPPCPLFFLFILVGIFFLNKPPVIMELVWRKCRWVVEQDFHGNFQINFSCFFTFFSGLLGYCLKDLPSPHPPPPPCTSCHSATLPMNIKTFYLTTDTRCGWVRITVLPNFFVACEGRGVCIKANVFAIIFFPANRPFSRWQHLTTTTRIHFILALLFKFFNPAGLLKQ